MTPLKSALAVLAAMLVGAAFAQQSPTLEDIAWKLAELGPVVDGPNTAKIYAPLQETEPYQGVKVDRGAFVAGDRREPGTPFFDNIALWAVRNGFVGINMTYRLAPQAKWPAGAADIGSALQWVADKIRGAGGGVARPP